MNTRQCEVIWFMLVLSYETIFPFDTSEFISIYTHKEYTVAASLVLYYTFEA